MADKGKDNSADGRAVSSSEKFTEAIVFFLQIQNHRLLSLHRAFKNPFEMSDE